jgi:uncharacterized membrane protein HdeD (DUF308 family)
MSEPLSGRIVDPGDRPGPGGPEGGPRSGPGTGAPAGRGISSLLSSKWAKAWIVPVVFGAASVVLGALVLLWPGHTVGALTALFGLYLLITGIYRFAAAIQLHGVDPIARVVAFVLAALSIGVGVVCLIDPFTTASTFAVVAGAFWFAAGAITWFGARQRRRSRSAAVGRAYGIAGAGGLSSMAIGVLIMLFPNASLVFLAVVLGFWLVFFGISAIATGLTARRLLKNVRNAVLYWP